MGFTEAWAETAAIEKGYVNNPNDNGGPTNHGVTEAVARANGWTGEMRDYPKADADRVAKKDYWDSLRLDDVTLLSAKIANELFDTGFLCGRGTAGKFVQRALSALNRNQKDYPDLVDDGNIGPATIAALKSFLTFRKADGELVMLLALNGQEISYLISLTDKNKKQEDFLFGWLLKRTSL